MAKYASKTDFPVITDPILDIVHDARGFVESKFCMENFRRGRGTLGTDPKQWKWVRVHSHRRAGFSTAALQLLNQYPVSMIITHSTPAAHRLRAEALDQDLVPDWCKDDFYHRTKIDDHIVTHERLDERWFEGKTPRKYELIILDCASMIEASRNNRHRGAIPGMDEFRDRLFRFCELLVELE
jgi:hypothetical protein